MTVVTTTSRGFVGRAVDRVDARGFVDRLSPPRVLLGAAMAIYATFYIAHLNLYHDRFWTTDYDLGIFDQSAWLLAHGKSFITIRGLSFWGHHVNPAMVLFVPFYWFGAGPRFLNAVMVISLTTGCIAVFRLTVHYVKNEWIALVLSVVFLLHTSSQYLLHETFHPEAMAIAPMLFAYLAVVERRWVAYWWWLAFAVLWKEDVAITAAMLGVVLLFTGKRKHGAWTVVLSVAYYFATTRWLLPAFSPGGAFYSNFLGDLGSSPQALARTALTHPTKIARQLDKANAVGYFRDLGEPYAFIPFVSPIGILIALPQTILNLLTIHAYSWSIRWHYVSMPLFGFTVSLVEGVGRGQRLLRRWGDVVARQAVGALVIVALLLTGVATSIRWSPSFGDHYRGNWPLFADARRAVLRDAVDLVPSGAPTAASYNLVPHLAHRERIYTFPNPWINSYWGVDVKNPVPGGPTVLPHPHNPAVVKWVAVDRRVLSEQAKTQLALLMDSADWETRLAKDDVVVLSRRE